MQEALDSPVEPASAGGQVTLRLVAVSTDPIAPAGAVEQGDVTAVHLRGRPRSPYHLTRYLPQVMIATFLVAVAPVALVWTLRVEGIIGSGLLTVGLGALLSVGTFQVGGLIWRSSAGSGDIMFSELLLWGWVRRWRIERQLASTQRLLQGLDGSLSPERRAKVLTGLARALEAGDPYTFGHSRRVARHATRIAMRLGLSSEQVAKVRTAAVLHDVGKINTPTFLLHKPCRLTAAEYGVIKRHPGDGADMVEKLGDPELTAMVRHHHERLDGTGYPDRLAGDSIPIGARIIAVADTFDAITSARPYRPASPHKKAMDILAKEAGTQLDPAAVEAFESQYAGRRALSLWLAVSKTSEGLVSWLAGAANAAAATSQVIGAAAITGAIASAAVSVPAAHFVASAHRGTAVAASAAAGSGTARRTKAPMSASAKVASGPRHRPGAGAARHANRLTRSSFGRGSGPALTNALTHGTGQTGAASNPGGGSPKSGAGQLGSNASKPGAGAGADGSGSRGAPSKASGSLPGKSGSAPGRSGSTPGQSGSTPGQSGSAPGRSGSTPGQSGSTPGQSGSTPGQSGSTPGQSGSTPGLSGSTPGLSGSAPGQSGSTPGQSGSTPGQSSSTPGQSSSTPGQSSSTPGLSGSTPHG